MQQPQRKPTHKNLRWMCVKGGDCVIIELTNHFVEMTQTYDIERVDESKYGGKLYFRFYFGNGKWSKEYSEPTYTYRILKA